MAIRIWRGDAQGVANVWIAKPGNVEAGDTFTLTINSKDITVTAGDDPDDIQDEDQDVTADAQNVVDLFVAKIGDTTIPEWLEVTATADTDDDDDDAPIVVLTGPSDGKPITITASTADAGDFDVTVTTLQEGSAGVNEKQKITQQGTTTSGTFTLTFDGQTTADIAFDASAFDVRDALCDLSNIAGTDEIQEVDVSGASSGDFTLTFDGQTTAAIAFDATAAQVQSALEALSNIAAGDVVCAGGDLNTSPVTVTFRENLGRQNVSEMTVVDSTDGTATNTTTTPGVDADVSVTGSDGGAWTVEFVETYAATNVPLMTSDGSSLDGGTSVSVTTDKEGSTGTNEIQSVTVPAADQITGWIIHLANADPLPNNNTSTLFSASAAEVQSALEAVVGSGNFSVSMTEASGDRTYTVEFIGAYGSTNIGNQLFYRLSGTATDTQFTVDQEGDATDSNEQQVVTLLGGPTGGTFTLTFSGQTTAGIAFDAAVGDVESALELLSNITDVTVTGNAGGPWTVTFEDPGGQDLAQMTGDATGLTGGGLTIITTQASEAAANEVQRVSIANSPSGGTFTLTWDPGGGDETTGNIAFDASAATVETALEALATPGAGDFDVSGDAGGPWQVEFEGTYASTDVNAMTGDGTNLTGGGSQSLTINEDIPPTGPHHFDEAENWSGGAKPVNGDTVIFENNDVDCLYGLAQSAVTLTLLQLKASYVGNLGLEEKNTDYYEYLDTYLQIGATTCQIGQGEGSGSGRIKIDFGSVQTELLVFSTGQPAGDLPALIAKGTHASNALRIKSGSFGSCVFGDESANWSGGVDIGFVSSVEDDSDVFFGVGCTLDAIDKSGGRMEAEVAVGGTLTQSGGESILNGTAPPADLDILGGVVRYNCSGTYTGTASLSNDAELNFDGDLRAKTFNNAIEVYGNDWRVVDNFKVVSGFIVDVNKSTFASENLEVGENVRITRGTPA